MNEQTNKQSEIKIEIEIFFSHSLDFFPYWFAEILYDQKFQSMIYESILCVSVKC